MAPCGAAQVAIPADSAAVTRLIGSGGLATGDALADGARSSSPWVPWLLGLALACALAELALRGRAEPESA
jgi:hypothetical protein